MGKITLFRQIIELFMGHGATPLKNDGMKVTWDDDIPN